MLPPNDPVWIFPKENPSWLKKIIQEFRIHPISAQILVSRGFTQLGDIHHFLYSKLPDLYDPQQFLDMSKAVLRIISALKKEEGILIYGDNDVDGMTGTALLVDFLNKIGGRVFYYIPNPLTQREGVFLDAIHFAKKHHCKLMITVDCGITASKEIRKIIHEKIDVIITDHHEPTDKIPNCIATLNPKLVNQIYPNRELTGVGVAFKLTHAIMNYFASQGELCKKKIDLKIFLDLVALGTIADMGVLLDENRILVRYGMKQLQKTKRIGLIKLFQVCGLERNDLSAFDIAPKIAPRMNSLGRVADPTKGVELLLVRDEKRATQLAKELDLFNTERQKIEQIVSENVEKMLQENPDILKNKAIILSSKNWHPGVIPIIAARIAKLYNRPTVIIVIDKKIGKGSIRTIREFPLLRVLKKCSDLFLNYGGHDYAAGLMIKEENISRFKQRFLDEANSFLEEQDIIPKIFLDAYADFKDLTYDLLASLELLEPYGNENPPPILYCQARQAWPPKIIGGMHLKLYLEQGDRMLEGIAFGMAERRNQLRKKELTIQIAYTPQINRFHNKSSIQLLIRDFRIIETESQ
ncbi:MAG: single-stranded-DNA-specific exonuclease RecJ [Chlamydiales bacterium]